MRREWEEGVKEREGEGGKKGEETGERRGKEEGGRSGIQYVKCSRLIPRPLPGLGRKFGNKGRKQQVEEPTYVPDRPSLIPSH